MAQYVITDGKGRYMKKDYQNHYAITGSEALADKFPRHIADKVYKNYIPKTLRKEFHIEMYETESSKEAKAAPHAVVVTEKDLKENSVKAKQNQDIQKWLNKAHSLNGLINEAVVAKEKLDKRLKDVDQEIIDIMHFIEWKRLNAAQMCKIYKMLKERREVRRNIKNELLVVEYIVNCTTKTAIEDELKKIIEGLDNRKYEPRKMTELYNL